MTLQEILRRSIGTLLLLFGTAGLAAGGFVTAILFVAFSADGCQSTPPLLDTLFKAGILTAFFFALAPPLAYVVTGEMRRAVPWAAIAGGTNVIWFFATITTIINHCGSH